MYLELPLKELQNLYEVNAYLLACELLMICRIPRSLRSNLAIW